VILIFVLFAFCASLFSQQKADRFPLKFEEDLIIKSSDPNNIYSFFASGLEVDSKGNIYVLDSYDKKILKFNKSGKYLKAFGGEGQGPGEFESVTNIEIDKQDNIYVQDIVRMALVVFDSNGVFRKNIRGTGIFYFSSDFMVGPSGHIYCGYQPLQSIGTKNIYYISMFDQDMNYLLNIYKKEGVILQYSVKTSSGSYSFLSPRYTPNVVWTMNPEGRIFISYNDSYKISIFSREGDFIKTISRDISPEKVTVEEKSQIRQEFEKRHPGLSKYVKFYNTKPHILRLTIVDNYLFALKKREDYDYYCDVFDVEGNFIDEVVLKFYPMISKKGYVYTIRFEYDGPRDAGNIIDSYIVRYKIIGLKK